MALHGRTATASPATGAPVAFRRARVAAIAALAVACCAAALGLAAWWRALTLPAPVQDRIDLLPDPHAKTGSLDAGEAANVEAGSFRLVMNQVAAMDSGSRTLPVAFENPAANGYAARLVLSLDGEPVAETGMVEPGSYVETVELDRTLPPGEHVLQARVPVYAGGSQKNEFTADVVVRVK